MAQGRTASGRIKSGYKLTRGGKVVRSHHSVNLGRRGRRRRRRRR